MTSKTTNVFVSDMFEELREDNKRLSNELSFERQLNEILENIRKYSLVLMNVCKCEQNVTLRQKLYEFNAKYDVLKLTKDMDKEEVEVIESNANIVFNSVNFTESNVNKKSKTSDNSRTNTSTRSRTAEEVLPICGQLEEDVEIYIKSEDNSNDNAMSSEETPDVSLSCNECEEVFESQTDRELHANSVHKSTTNFSLEDYFKRVDSSLHLVKPRKWRKRVAKKTCSRVNTTAITVEEMDESDGDDNDNCESLSSNAFTEKAFKCNECQKSFRQKWCLEKHMTCEHKKLFVCRHCSQCFNTNDILLTHMSKTHRIRSFRCDLCTHRSYSKQNLTVHRVTHSGEKPYVCDYDGCNKGFRRSDILLHHKRAMHKVM